MYKRPIAPVIPHPVQIFLNDIVYGLLISATIAPCPPLIRPPCEAFYGVGNPLRYLGSYVHGVIVVALDDANCPQAGEVIEELQGMPGGKLSKEHAVPLVGNRPHLVVHPILQLVV